MNVGYMWKKKNALKIFMGKAEEKRSLERHRYRFEDNIKTGLKEVGW
jgi:hypothetical protein